MQRDKQKGRKKEEVRQTGRKLDRKEGKQTKGKERNMTNEERKE